MTGDYYRNNHPGGISAVVSYWSRNIEALQFYPTYKSGGRITKGWWFITTYIRLALRMMTDRKVRLVHQHTAADGSFWKNVRIQKLCRFFGRKTILHIHASRFKDFLITALIILTPMGIIIMQSETGSALVYVLSLIHI